MIEYPQKISEFQLNLTVQKNERFFGSGEVE